MAKNINQTFTLGSDFLLKVITGVVTTGLIALITMLYNTTTQIAIIQSDVTYVRETLKSFDSRLTKVEETAFTNRDMEQLKTWMELKIEALKVKIEHNKSLINKSN